MKKQAINIQIPDDAKKVLSLLEENGHTAYLVGGFIRDQIRAEDEAPQDIDIATSARPNEVEQMFASSEWTPYPLGKKFGTIGLVMGSEAKLNIKSQNTTSKQDASVPTITTASDPKTIEITTYRTEKTYTDGRHPDEVCFADSIDEDLSRRDFTCNAIACDINGNIVDPFNGIEDIHNNVVRCVGDAKERFKEDHLRILRALRFSAQLGFEIEADCASAIRKMKGSINSVSAERIREELTKLLCGKNAKEILTIYSDVIFEIIPELKPLYKYDQKTKYHSHDAWEHTLIVVDKMPGSPIGRWAALLHDIGKPDCFTMDEEGQGHFYGHPERSAEIAKVILKRLKFSNKMADSILLLIKYHDRQMAATKKSVKKMLRHFADVNTELPTEEMFRIYCDLRRADSYAHDENFRGYLTFTNKIETVFDEILAEEEVFSLKDLAIGGNEIMELGIEPGPKISELLKVCLDAVINEEIKNTKTELRKFIKTRI